jgi:hypothetical protein
MPIVPTDGNHDVHYNPNYSYHFNTDNTFKTHASVKPYADGTTYSFMYGDVLFLVFSLQDYWRGDYDYSTLTSVYLQNDIANWFRDQIEAYPNAKMRVGLVHYNIFSGSSHQDDEMGPLLRASLLPIMKECDIDIVLQGHDHCYEVMGPVDNNVDAPAPIMEAIAEREVVSTSESMSGYKGGTYTVDNGTLYFIGATCGDKRYDPYTKEEMEALIENCNLSFEYPMIKISNKDDNTKFILLPQAGYKTPTGHMQSGGWATYWTSTIGSNTFGGQVFMVYSSLNPLFNPKERFWGFPIRPVYVPSN